MGSTFQGRGYTNYKCHSYQSATKALILMKTRTAVDMVCCYKTSRTLTTLLEVPSGHGCNDTVSWKNLQGRPDRASRNEDSQAALLVIYLLYSLRFSVCLIPTIIPGYVQYCKPLLVHQDHSPRISQLSYFICTIKTGSPTYRVSHKINAGRVHCTGNFRIDWKAKSI